jgi:hypothetical protein
MKSYKRKSWFIFPAIFFFIIATAHVLWAASETEIKPEVSQNDASTINQDSSDSRLNRIDFGNTYIIGQTIKSGAVYLLQRKKSEIKSMLRYRQDYRQEILDGFSVDKEKEMIKEQTALQSNKSDHQGDDDLVSKK